MFFWKNNQNNKRDNLKKYNPKEIYLLTTDIISSYGTGDGPMCFTQCYLATKENKKFYELFSRVEITYEGRFDIPFIKKVEKFEKYVKDPNIKLTAEELFYFINRTNAANRVQEHSVEENNDETEYEED